MKPITPDWSRSQLDFVEGLRQAGALSEHTAASVEPAMRLSESELAPLLESGLVREAGRGRYYLREMTRTQNFMLAMAATERKDRDDLTSPRRFLRTILFWLILILIPIILLQLIGPGS